MTAQLDYLRKNLKKPVVLVGMMGSGKSRVGQQLAKELKFDFYDSDTLVEQKAGCSIAEIFEKFGEQKFRDSESRTILELMDKKAAVIATGGGAVTNDATLATIKQKSHSIWLRADIDEIFSRVKHNQNRPLLKADDPKAVLLKLMDQRKGLYSQADITIDSVPGSPEETSRNLIKALYGFVNPDKF